MIDTRRDLIASLLALGGAFTAALSSVNLKYLENQGLSWLSTNAIAQCGALFFCCLIWIGWQMYTFYNNIGIDGNHSISSLKQHLFSVFPSKSDSTSWRLLILSGLAFSLQFEFYLLALLYIEVADVMLIRTLMATIGLCIIGVIFWKENVSIYMIFALIIAFGGVIMVCQPSFIFGDTLNEISWIGVIFILIAAFWRVLDKITIKLSKSQNNEIDIHWLAVTIVPLIITSMIALLQLIGVSIYVSIETKSEINLIGGSDRTNVIIAASLYGLILAVNSSLVVMAYQMGSLGRLGIIANCDIVFGYVLQAWLLSTVSNIYVYIGASLVFIGVGILVLEQYRLSHVGIRNQHHQPQREFEPDNINEETKLMI